MQIAVDDPNQIVELLSGGKRNRSKCFGLVGFAVAKETPDLCCARIVDLAVEEVLAESCLVNRIERTESHRDRWKLPELGHEPRVRVTRKSSAADFSAELRHFFFAQSAFEIGARINAGSCVTLQVNVIANQRS